MFILIFTSIITLMHVYVFWRILSVPYLKRRVPRKYIIGAGLFILAVFILGLFVGYRGTGPLALILEFLGMTWLGVLFLMFSCMIFTDIITGFGFFCKKTAPRLRGAALIVSLILCLIALIQGMRPPAVHSFDVSLSELPEELDGMVIVAMSDLHVGSVIGPRWMEARIDQALNQEPDLIVLVGDLFEVHGESGGKLLRKLKRLSAPCGVLAVTGNHEFYGRDNSRIDVIEEAGFQLLRNEWEEVKPGLVVAGVDDFTVARRRFGKGEEYIEEALKDRPEGAVILLSHTPWYTDHAAGAGVCLMICGHTHGGQIWPFNYLVRMTYPLMGGRYEVEDMTVLVCRGTGTWGPRMRLWRRGEMFRITLHRA